MGLSFPSVSRLAVVLSAACFFAYIYKSAYLLLSFSPSSSHFLFIKCHFLTQVDLQFCHIIAPTVGLWILLRIDFSPTPPTEMDAAAGGGEPLPQSLPIR
jgi:hypothetical protein